MCSLNALNFIALIPSRSIRQMLATISGAEYYSSVSKTRKRVLFLRPPRNVNFGIFTSDDSGAVTAIKKCTKKRDARANLFFC